jgi:hypothetical protein
MMPAATVVVKSVAVVAKLGCIIIYNIHISISCR